MRIDIGDEYQLKATRVRAGSFEVVAIDWKHPNFGYFADFMIWIISPHLGDWIPHPLATGSQYEDVDKFIKDFPEFKPMFEREEDKEDFFQNLLEAIREGEIDL